MTFSHDDKREKVTVRVGTDLADALDDLAVDHGDKSEFVRNAIIAALPDESDHQRFWHDDEMNRAYWLLRKLANEDNIVSQSAALSLLAQQLGQSPDVLKAGVISKLRKRNALTHKQSVDGLERVYVVNTPEGQ